MLDGISTLFDECFRSVGSFLFSNIFLFLEFPVQGAVPGIIPVQLPSLLPVGFTGQGKVGLTLKICGEDSVRSEVAKGGIGAD
jgi:hypothetical protein